MFRMCRPRLSYVFLCHSKQEAKRLHEKDKVPYMDMAVLYRAFKGGGSKTHQSLQVRQT
jgi:hypothetical protein